jgi:multimeric flavodoxin WrbA
MKKVIIQGSARSEGNTYKITQILKKHLVCDTIDLNLFKINQYNYNHEIQLDDFLPLIRKIVEYDVIIFATPIYWYTMSGIMKTFFDRITECLKTEKETGRKLRGKYMTAMCCGSDERHIKGFFMPFEETAKYLGMNYLGDIHTWVEKEEPSNEVLNLIENYALQLDKIKN